MFKYQEHLSENLNKGLDMFIERMDMTNRDRELFYDIINFAFHEGRITGKEEILDEPKKYSDEKIK